jgi:hypothetical protein
MNVVPARPELTGASLALAWPGGPPMAITWSLGPDNGGRVLGWCLAPAARGAAARGELVVADLHATDPGQLEIADVICCPARHSGDLPDSALRHVLERYPGCAVVATGSGAQECRVGTRGCPTVTVTVQRGYWETGARAVLAGCFVYGWVAAGRPATLLDSGWLMVRPPTVREHVAGITIGVSRYRNGVSAL